MDVDYLSWRGVLVLRVVVVVVSEGVEAVGGCVDEE